MKKLSKLKPIAAAALCLLPLIVAGCSGSKPAASQAPPPPIVEVVQVEQQDMPVYGEWIGTLDGMVNAEIKAQVSGYLLKQYYVEGSFVRKGQLLFEIDPRPLQAALDQARSRVAEAQGQLAQANGQMLQARAQVDLRLARAGGAALVAGLFELRADVAAVAGVDADFHVAQERRAGMGVGRQGEETALAHRLGEQITLAREGDFVRLVRGTACDHDQRECEEKEKAGVPHVDHVPGE